MDISMKFDRENYPTIKEACENKKNIDFYVEKLATGFNKDNIPSNWTAYSPASLTREAYAQIFIGAGNDARGTLTKLELAVHLDGGRIEYKEKDEAHINLRVTF